MSLFEELNQFNFIPLLREGERRGLFKASGPFPIELKQRASYNGFWLYSVNDPERNCLLWKDVYFDLAGIIPLGCRNCWKIFFRPKTIQDVYKTWMLQKDLGIPGKVGAELREFTGHLGGYFACWYSDLSLGIKEGQRLLKFLQGQFKHDTLHLKRGCSEMEKRYPPSTGWDANAKAWDTVEANLEKLIRFVPAPIDPRERESIEADVLQRLILRAAYHGDLTYLNFMDHSIIGEAALYDHVNPKEGEYVCTYFGNSVNRAKEVDSSKLVSLD